MKHGAIRRTDRTRAAFGSRVGSENLVPDAGATASATPDSQPPRRLARLKLDARARRRSLIIGGSLVALTILVLLGMVGYRMFSSQVGAAKKLDAAAVLIEEADAIVVQVDAVVRSDATTGLAESANAAIIEYPKRSGSSKTRSGSSATRRSGGVRETGSAPSCSTRPPPHGSRCSRRDPRSSPQRQGVRRAAAGARWVGSSHRRRQDIGRGGRRLQPFDQGGGEPVLEAQQARRERTRRGPTAVRDRRIGLSRGGIRSLHRLHRHSDQHEPAVAAVGCRMAEDETAQANEIIARYNALDQTGIAQARGSPRARRRRSPTRTRRRLRRPRSRTTMRAMPRQRPTRRSASPPRNRCPARERAHVEHGDSTAVDLEQAVLLQLRERARQRLGHRAERHRELALLHPEVDLEALAGGRAHLQRALEDVARQPARHVERERLDDCGEVDHARREVGDRGRARRAARPRAGRTAPRPGARDGGGRRRLDVRGVARAAPARPPPRAARPPRASRTSSAARRRPGRTRAPYRPPRTPKSRRRVALDREVVPRETSRTVRPREPARPTASSLRRATAGSL